MGSRAPRILLVNPWITDFAAYDFWIKPVGLLMLAGILKKAGCDVVLLDCLDRAHPAVKSFFRNDQKNRGDGTGHFIKEPLDKPAVLEDIPRQYSRYGLPYDLVVRQLNRNRCPDLILMTSGMTYWYPGVQQMSGLLKSVFPGVPIALGGVYATLCTDHAERCSGADLVLPGEGEEAVLKLVEELCGWNVIAEIPGGIPLPDYSLYDSLFSASLLTSRGCPYRCPYCASRLLAKSAWRLSPETVLRHVRDLHDSKRVTEFAFYDDALLIPKEDHIVPILRKSAGSGPPVHFHTPNGLHPRQIDETLAGLMVRSGFRTVRLSYETCNPERQKKLGMKVGDADLKRAVRLLLRAGMPPEYMGSYVLMGLPGQPLAEVLQSMRTVWDLGIRVSLASFSPIPGTESWEEAVHAGFLERDADPLLTNSSVFPLRSESVTFRDFIRIGTLAAEGNRMVVRGNAPFRDPDFARKAERFESL